MLNKKRDKSNNKEKEKEKEKVIEKEKNNKKDKKKNKNKLNNKNENRLYEFPKNQNFTLDGFGKLKLIEGNLDIFGYSLSENEIIEFNFNEDYPIFKYRNSNSSPSKFEIFNDSKYNIYTDIQQLQHASNIPKALLFLNYNDFSKYLICGIKCAGKNMLIPYIINRILSNKEKKLYFLECDIIHPLIPINYAISLIEIKKPIISNIPILFSESQNNQNNSYYNLIKSFYIRNSFDIKNVINVLDILINEIYLNIADDKSIILINQFSAWDNNDEVLNNYLFKKYFKTDNKSCVLYIKNKYKNYENISNDNKEKNNKSILEDIIFKNKNDFYLFGNLFEENSKEKEKDIKCHKIEVDTKYEGDDTTNTNCNLDINNKKKNEEKLSILSHFEENKCKQYSLPLKNIIIIFDNPYIYELKNDCKSEQDNTNLKNILIESLLNKYCVIMRNNLKETKENTTDDDNLFENYFLDDIPYDKREIISYTKIISFDKIENTLCFYCQLDIDEEIKKNKKIMLLIDHRIEKVIKKTKNNTFFNALSKATFSYDITKENETLNLSNGLNYLGKYEEE